jgi:hypothetical protein
MRNAYKISVEKSEGKRPLGINGHRRDGNTKWTLKKYVLNVRIGFIWLSTGSSDHGNESSCYIITMQLSDS